MPVELASPSLNYYPERYQEKYMKNHAIKCNSFRAQNPGNLADVTCSCDGYHTWDELYDHRITCFIALCKVLVATGYVPQARMTPTQEAGKVHLEGLNSTLDRRIVWRSKNHSDGTPSFGDTWFVFGIGTQKANQVTYHIPISRWGETDFAETWDKAPEYDGHTSDDVLNRLKEL